MRLINVSAAPQVISKGMVLHNFKGVVGHLSKLITFAVTVSAEMTPTFTLVAMVTSPNGHLISDSITIPVLSINRYQVNQFIQPSTAQLIISEIGELMWARNR